MKRRHLIELEDLPWWPRVPRRRNRLHRDSPPRRQDILGHAAPSRGGSPALWCDADRRSLFGWGWSLAGPSPGIASEEPDRVMSINSMVSAPEWRRH
jgi:hypothetical protein